MAYEIDLSGRVAFVTGASGGLRAQFAKTLAAAGAGVVLASRRVEKLKDLRAEIEAAGGDAHVVEMDVTDAELKRLASRGFRAVRFHLMKHITGGHDVADVVKLTSRLAAVGMHLQVHFESALVHTVGQELLKSAVPVVIDHMGRVDAALGERHEDFQALMKLLDHSHVHVKVSGIDRIESTARAGSGYPLGVKLEARLVERFPNQCVGGLDWPHPNHTHIPDDGELVDALSQVAPTKELLEKLLATNPQALYKFIA